MRRILFGLPAGQGTLVMGCPCLVIMASACGGAPAAHTGTLEVATQPEVALRADTASLPTTTYLSLADPQSSGDSRTCQGFDVRQAEGSAAVDVTLDRVKLHFRRHEAGGRSLLTFEAGEIEYKWPERPGSAVTGSCSLELSGGGSERVMLHFAEGTSFASRADCERAAGVASSPAPTGTCQDLFDRAWRLALEGPPLLQSEAAAVEALAKLRARNGSVFLPSDTGCEEWKFGEGAGAASQFGTLRSRREASGRIEITTYHLNLVLGAMLHIDGPSRVAIVDGQRRASAGACHEEKWLEAVSADRISLLAQDGRRESWYLSRSACQTARGIAGQAFASYGPGC